VVMMMLSWLSTCGGKPAGKRDLKANETASSAARKAAAGPAVPRTALFAALRMLGGCTINEGRKIRKRVPTIGGRVVVNDSTYS
jgi:hypothetical protein